MKEEKIIDKEVEVNCLLCKKNKEKAKELSALREIGKEISLLLDLDEVLTTIIDRAIELLNGQKACIILLDQSTKELKIAIHKGLSEEEIKRFKDQVLEDISQSHISHSYLSTPLRIKDTIIGAINIRNGSRGRGFSKRSLDILKELADQAAIAIDNARSHLELQNVALDTVKSLAMTIDQKDHYTSCHSENVACYAEAIAREMNLSEEEIQKIEQAAQLHDIGKIGVRDYILSKPGKLTPEEWEEVKTHTLKGAEILKPLEFLNGIVEVVKQHHERPNGKGYPQGLKKEEIVIGARIMAVADSFDAMTSERPYRPAFSRQKAIDEIKDLAGVMYDPEVVNAFLRAIDNKSI